MKLTISFFNKENINEKKNRYCKREDDNSNF